MEAKADGGPALFCDRRGLSGFGGTEHFGNIQTDNLLLFLERTCGSFWGDWIPLLPQQLCMIIKRFDGYAVLLTPDFDISLASPAFCDQIKPFLIRMFDTFLSHCQLTPSYYINGVCMHRADERL